ncbi:MAG: PAS domain S-box protein [Rhodoferax sp.]|nr:PAS domain S-box protein [Rhodoferax sp.]
MDSSPPLHPDKAMRCIVETALDGYWLTDAAGNLLDVNTAYCEQSGYSRDELLQMKIGDLEALEDNAETAARMRNIMLSGWDRFVSVHRGKSGALSRVGVSVTYHPSEGGRFFVFLRNLSEQKLTEAEVRVHRDHLRTELARQELALKSSHAFNQSVLSSLTAEIAVVNVFGTIVAVNEPWLGFTLATGLETNVGSNYFNACQPGGRFAHEEDADSAYKGLRAVMNGRLRRFNLDYPCHLASQQRWFTMTVTPLLHEGRSRVVVTHTEITIQQQQKAEIQALNTNLEQRVAQRTRELSETLERLTATQAELVQAEKMSALGFMVAGVSHELNTPIGSSLTVASALQAHAQEFTDNMAQGLTRSQLDNFVRRVREGSDILMHALSHAAELVASFKQVSVDQASVNRRIFDLRTTVDTILLTLGTDIGKTGHTVKCQIPEGIRMDSFPGPLGQVLTNLIHNALLHAFENKPHGEVTITAILKDAQHVCMTIQDDGDGIAPEHLNHVFDPFFTTKLGKGGSGLGLHIVYNLVQELLGGNIQVDNTPDSGACFTLLLPLDAPS